MLNCNIVTMKESVLAIDTGGTGTRLWHGDGAVRRISTIRCYGDYLAMVKNAVRETGAETVVIGIAAIVDKHRIVVNAVNLGPEWSGKNLAADILADSPSLKRAAVLQDTEAAGYKAQTQLADNTEAMLITLSTGVGGAWVNNQFVKPLELGHLPLNLSGKDSLCGCGQLGCSEADLCGAAIKQLHGKAAEDIDDPEFWSDYGYKIGRFFMALTSLFKLKKLVLIGGISSRYELFRQTCGEYLQKHLKYVPLPEITIMDEPDNVGAYGAYIYGSLQTNNRDWTTRVLTESVIT